MSEGHSGAVRLKGDDGNEGDGRIGVARVPILNFEVRPIRSFSSYDIVLDCGFRKA